MRKVLGGRSTAIYVAGVVLSSWVAAAAYQFFLDDGSIARHVEHLHEELPLWKHIGGALLIALLVAPSVANRFGGAKEATSKKLQAGLQTATITIEGMTCSHCESSMSDGLANLPFVRSVVSVDRNANAAVIQGDAIDETAVRSKVESLGFEYKGAKIS